MKSKKADNVIFISLSKNLKSVQTANMISIPKKYLHLFPKYGVQFEVQTNAGLIKTHLAGEGPAYPEGHAFTSGMKKWVQHNNDLNVSDVLEIKVLEPLKCYQLTVKRNSIDVKPCFAKAVDKYMRALSTTNWIFNEAYKFEFANFIHANVDWKNQSDQEILEICRQSQKTLYTGKSRGIQFILKSGRKKAGNFINESDVSLFRQMQNHQFHEFDWEHRTMSFTGLSAWLASLFPDKIYPAPMKGFDETINYLFNGSVKIPKTDLAYINECQNYLSATEKILMQYPVQEVCLKVWNKFYEEHPHLKINQKISFDKLDWVWLVQDFHLFVYRHILGLYKKKAKDIKLQDVVEPTVIEGNTVLATHMRYERNSGFIRRIKQKALLENKMLNCEVCGFSFLETYGEAGEGFIEAHHKNPLHTVEGESKTSPNDIALVCSNCHRMLHRGNPIYSIDEMKKMMAFL